MTDPLPGSAGDRSPLAVAVFASGGGTNLQALLDHPAREGEGDVRALWRVRLLVMNREADAARRAREADVPVRIVPTTGRSADEVAAETLALLDDYRIDVVLLAGYLRLLPAEVVSRYRGRILNIHPALLPDFGGKGMYGQRVHEAVVEAGVPESGATVHFVTEAYDEGDILAQGRVAVRPGDSAESLAARVLELEHRLYPRAVDHLCAALRESRTPGRMSDVTSPTLAEEEA